MKVLWFSNTSSNYSNRDGIRGGGWISSAEKEITKLSDIELAISFILPNQPFKTIIDGVTYYPINPKLGWFRKFRNKLTFDKVSVDKSQWEYYVSLMMQVIEDFQPDVIHVWGSELFWGLIASVVDIPVLLHIQGIINPCVNAFLPPGVGQFEYSKSTFKPSLNGLRNVLNSFLEGQHWRANAYREKEIFSRVSHFIGRTEWDKRVTHILNPEANYYYGGEILRDSFYVAEERVIPEKLIIITTISKPLYKGLDLLLKTAYFLKYNLSLDFEWKVFGQVDSLRVEKLVGFNSVDVNVQFLGLVSESRIKAEELNSTCYVHTSYIDNSPNSICEAQILGVPCISTNVGGIPTLINHGETGFLVPSNDPYQLACAIEDLYYNVELNVKVGAEGKRVAIERHNKQHIIAQLVDVYRDIVKK